MSSIGIFNFKGFPKLESNCNIRVTVLTNIFKNFDI